MLIGAVSRQTGVSARLLRYYEERDLLKPRRLTGGFREYSEDDVRTVRRIRALLAVGLSTRTIAQLMPFPTGVPDGDGPPPPVRPEVLEGLRRERRRISDAAAGLLAARDVLDIVIADAQPLAHRPG